MGTSWRDSRASSRSLHEKLQESEGESRCSELDLLEADLTHQNDEWTSVFLSSVLI